MVVCTVLVVAGRKVVDGRMVAVAGRIGHTKRLDP